MDFFAQQDRARRNTRLLVVLFLLAVALLIFLANALVTGALWIASDYNLYTGSLSAVRSGVYDHGTDAPIAPLCDARTESAGGNRLSVEVSASAPPAADLYFLVTAHVGDVESPAGFTSTDVEIDRSESICR